MKSSSSLAYYGAASSTSTLFGIPVMAVTAAAACCCSLTVVLAWSATCRYRNNAASINIAHACRDRMLWWQRSIFKVQKSSFRRLHSSGTSTKNNNEVDDENPSTCKTTESNDAAHPKNKKSRFTTVEDSMMMDGGTLRVHPIGTVRSVYRLCVGTPRQGMLAPHALARIELHNLYDDRTGVEAAASVDGIQDFSHIWIVFVFHLNTIGKRKHTKIAPPALGGIRKVGVLATRSPHRLNPIGMTLAKLDGIRTLPPSRSSNGRKQGATTVLDISGCDLVDGTPVLDIKPYVPYYDTVPRDDCIVPDWVADGLSTKRTVQFTDQSTKELETIVWNHSECLEFYGNTTNATKTIPKQDIFESLKECIEEVLAVDVRSQHQTNKARLGQSRAEKADRLLNRKPVPVDNETTTNTVMCTQQLDNLLVSFTVMEAPMIERQESSGSGAEDVVTVESIALISTQ